MEISNISLFNKEILSSKPFRMVMVAPSGAGKTMYLLYLLDTELYKSYDYIYLISSQGSKKIYKKHVWFNHMSVPESTFQLDQCIGKIMNHALDELDKKNNYKFLIILDDIGAHSTKSAGIINLFTNGRHYNISVVFQAQSHDQIPYKAKKSITHLIFFTNIYNDIENMVQYLSLSMDIKYVKAEILNFYKMRKRGPFIIQTKEYDIELSGTYTDNYTNTFIECYNNNNFTFKLWYSRSIYKTKLISL